MTDFSKYPEEQLHELRKLAELATYATWDESQAVILRRKLEQVEKWAEQTAKEFAEHIEACGYSIRNVNALDIIDMPEPNREVAFQFFHGTAPATDLHIEARRFRLEITEELERRR